MPNAKRHHASNPKTALDRKITIGVRRAVQGFVKDAIERMTAPTTAKTRKGA